MGREKSGYFLTVEGIEGAGKSTLAGLLADRLRCARHEVVLTAEPGGDAVADRIAEILLDSVELVTDRAELLLFEAARAQHVDAVVLPALERGAVVICDRFADSSLAYQGYARGIELATVRSLNEFATRGLRPDLTILLDLEPETGLSRQQKTDRISSEAIAFHTAVRNGFLEIARAEPERFAVIAAGQPVDVVLRCAMDAVRSRTGIGPRENRRSEI